MSFYMSHSYSSNRIHVIFSTKERHKASRTSYNPNSGLTWPESPAIKVSKP